MSIRFFILVSIFWLIALLPASVLALLVFNPGA